MQYDGCVTWVVCWWCSSTINIRPCVGVLYMCDGVCGWCRMHDSCISGAIAPLVYMASAWEPARDSTRGQPMSRPDPHVCRLIYGRGICAVMARDGGAPTSARTPTRRRMYDITHGSSTRGIRGGTNHHHADVQIEYAVACGSCDRVQWGSAHGAVGQCSCAHVYQHIATCATARVVI